MSESVQRYRDLFLCLSVPYLYLKNNVFSLGQWLLLNANRKSNPLVSVAVRAEEVAETALTSKTFCQYHENEAK